MKKEVYLFVNRIVKTYFFKEYYNFIHISVIFFGWIVGKKELLLKIWRPLKTLLNIYGMKDVERKDSFGKTPIHYAQTEGHFSTARILELRLIESDCPAKRFKSQWRKKYICVSTELSEYIFSKNITISFIQHFFSNIWTRILEVCMSKSNSAKRFKHQWRKKNICVCQNRFVRIYFSKNNNFTHTTKKSF